MDGTLWIGNERREGARQAVHEPWSGDRLGEVTLADANAAERAMQLAYASFDVLQRLPAHARRDGLLRVAKALAQRREELANVLAREAAKPISQARAEVMRAESTFEVAAEETTRLGGEALSLDITPAGEGYRAVVWRVPTGPILGISPFNFPLNLVAHKVAPALACGCPIVLKPAPQTPFSSLLLAEIVRGAYGADGALTVVPCEVDVAEILVKDPRFSTLSFTGSAKVGWHLKSISEKKRVLLELGGNAAAIVHDDADLAFAIPRIVSGAFAYAGQVCIKVQRLYVHDSIYDRVVSDLVSRAQSLSPRSPLDPDAVLSAMIDEPNAIRVESWIAEALQSGAKSLVLGKREKNRLSPSIVAFEGSGIGNKIVDEEVFGPVLTVHRYTDWDDALTMADASRYGLQAGIFTDSRARIDRAFSRLHVGGLIVGDVPTFRVDNMPYGGTRDSGFGREGVRYAIEEMTERKTMVTRQARK